MAIRELASLPVTFPDSCLVMAAKCGTMLLMGSSLLIAIDAIALSGLSASFGFSLIVNRYLKSPLRYPANNRGKQMSEYTRLSETDINEYWTIALIFIGGCAIGFIIGFGLGQ